MIRAQNRWLASPQFRATQMRSEFGADGDRGWTRPDAEREVLKQSQPVIAASSDNLGSILRDGFKTQHDPDIDYSGGTYDPLGRKAVEDHLFGPSEIPPVYGYAAHGAPNDSANAYGDLHFVLKERVKDRATVTAGDSLGTTPLNYADEPKGPVLVPTAPWRDVETGHAPLSRPLSQVPTAEGSTRPLQRGMGRLGVQHDYTEMQVHGGVEPGDIDHVVKSEPRRPGGFDRRFPDYYPPQDADMADGYVGDALRREKIPYRIERHIASATQTSFPDIDGGHWPGRGDVRDRGEPIYADVETYQPNVHHTRRDPDKMRKRLLDFYPQIG